MCARTLVALCGVWPRAIPHYSGYQVRKVTLIGRADEVLAPWVMVGFTDDQTTELVTVKGQKLVVPPDAGVVVADGNGGWTFVTETLPELPEEWGVGLRDPGQRVLDRLADLAPEAKRTLELLRGRMEER